MTSECTNEIARVLTKAATLLLLCTEMSQGEPIPSTRGTHLSGQTITLPQDLNTRFTVLILGFSRKSSQSSTEWGKSIEEDLGTDRNVTWLAVPILPDLPRPLRGVLVRAFHKAVPASLQASFVLVFENDSEWKTAVSFDAEDDAYVLLVNQQGDILWRTHGPVSREQMSELQQAMMRISSQPVADEQRRSPHQRRGAF
jgi:hypothetical protein